MSLIEQARISCTYFEREALNSCKRLSTLALRNDSSLVLFPWTVPLTFFDSSTSEL